MVDKKEGLVYKLREFYRHEIRFFTHSAEEDIILAVNYIRVNLKQGKNIDSVIRDIADKRFGKVSRLFRKAIATGKPARSALLELSKKKMHPGLKEFVSCLMNDYRDFNRLSYSLVMTLSKDKKSDLDSSTRKLDSIANWLVMMPLLPVAVLIIDLLNSTIGQIPPEAGLSFPNPLLPAPLVTSVVITGAALITVILAIMKVRIKW
jgi:hypothetical protein